MNASLVGILLLLLASAFFSGSEVALFALNRIQLRRMQKSADALDRRAAGLLGRPADLLSTILVGNTLVNVATAALVTTLMLSLVPNPDLAAALATVFGVIVVLAFGEVLPKTVAIRAPATFARLAATPLLVVRSGFRPLVLVLSGVATVLLRWMGLRPTLQAGGSVSDTDLRSLFDTLGEEAGILAEERRFARRIFEFSTAKTAEVMTPRVDIRAVDRRTAPESVAEVIRSSRHARLPVYDGSLDEIVGFINAKQYLLGAERQLELLLQPVLFVPEQKRVSDLFHEIQRQATGMVVVVDEYGHTVGIITKEDLVEEIVGEIFDEYEAEQAPIVKLGPDRFLVDGLLAVSDLAEELEVELESEAVTVNGMLSELLGRIPHGGDRAEIGEVSFRVLDVRRHRVVRCEVRRHRGDGRPQSRPGSHAGDAAGSAGGGEA